MDYERAHRSGSSSSELFTCFTSRPSTNYSSMKMSSSKSIRSPGHGGDKSHEPTLTLSSSLKNRRLRTNGSIRSGQFSPMFPSSKKRGCSFETPEPSSPKVTCIGQVRVKTKKQGKKMLAITKRKTDHKTQDGILQHQQQHSCLPQRNQKWAYFPFTICEALRSFGADLNCFLPCGSRSFCSSSMSEREKEEQMRAATGETVPPRTSCGPIFERWLMALQEGEVEAEDKMGREDMEMLLAEEEEGIIIRKNMMEMEEVGKGEAQEEESDGENGDEPKRASICLPFKDVNEPKRVSICLPYRDSDDPKRLSVCLPPKNALLLMRCRSDPLRMSSLANRFWESSLPKDNDDDDDDEYDDEGDSVEEEEEVEEMNLELEEKYEVEEVLEEEVNSFQAKHHPEEEGKELEQNEEVEINGSSSEAEENPRMEEEMQQVEEEKEKQEVEVEVELSAVSVENLGIEEESMLEEVEEDQEVEHNSDSVENPRTEKEPMLLEVEEENQEVEQSAGSVVEEEPVLQEDQMVVHNTGAVEKPRAEEEPMLQEVLEENQEVEQNCSEALQNSRIEEGPMLQEIVIETVEEVVEKDTTTSRSSELFVHPDREEEADPELVAGEQEGEDEAVSDLEEESAEKSSSIEEKECEDKGGLLINDEEIEITQEISAMTMVKKEQEEMFLDHYDDDNGDDKGGEAKSLIEGSERERKVIMLPDCMMWMMMCEPKLSMEVSKETWVCSGDFIRRSWPDHNPRLPPQLILNNEAADDVGNNHSSVQQQQQCPRSNSLRSISRNPKRSVVLSMASMIEQKLVKAVAYEPVVLMRCKSEPLRSSSRLISSRVMNFDHA